MISVHFHDITVKTSQRQNKAIRTESEKDAPEARVTCAKALAEVEEATKPPGAAVIVASIAG